MRNILLLFFLLINCFIVHGQTAIDSLEQALKNTDIDTVKIRILLQISDACLKTDPKKSLEIALKTEEICTNRKNDLYNANALKQIAICQFELFKKEEALQNIDRAIAIYTQINDDKGLVDSYNVRGNIFELQTEFSKAIQDYTQAQTLALKINYKSGLSLAYISLGMTYYSIDNLEKAVENTHKSLEIDSLINNKSGIARAYNNMGLIYDQKGDYQKSLEYYNRAYPILIELGDKRQLSRLLTNIGIIYSYLKDYAKTLENYQKSIKIKREIDDEFGIANIYNNIGVVFMQQKQFDSTLVYMKLALNIYTQLDTKRDIAVSYGNLGSVYRHMGNDAEAIKYIEKAISLRLETSDIKGAGRSYLSKGYLYTDKNNLPLAMQSFRNALECGEKSGDERLKMESYMRISSIYEKQNNSKQALLYYQKFHASSDTIYNHQKQKQLLELQTKYETAQKNNEIEKLNNTNEINKLNLEKSRYMVKQQRTIIGVVLFIVLLLGLFSIVYYRLFRQKQIANQVLKEKQFEIEHQNHEIIRQHNSLEKLNLELEIQKENVMNQRDRIEAELKRTLLTSEILQRENIQFKFEALKNQLNPHFLFNTFSTLIELIPTNAELAEQYTRNLSSVYRYILTGKDKEMVKLSEEINFVNAYMFLISIRFDDNVKLAIDIEDDKYDYYLPLLSLQLLIENAVKHNIISNRKPLLISIKSNHSSLIVTNNLQKKSSIENSTKIGLQNIITRYQLISAETVEIEQTETHFTVKLPLLKENSYL
jgi:tetratricopeptide (TPR) repeat protein